MATNQNTRTVTDETLAEVLTRSQRRRLSDAAERIGFTPQQMVRRGVDLFLDVEAPVYLAQAKKAS